MGSDFYRWYVDPKADSVHRKAKETTDEWKIGGSIEVFYHFKEKYPGLWRHVTGFAAYKNKETKAVSQKEITIFVTLLDEERDVIHLLYDDERGEIVRVI